MSAADELVALGNLGGVETFAMLRRTFRSASKPFGSLTLNGWDEDQRDEALQAFLTDKLVSLGDALLVAARDGQDAVEKLTFRIMKAWLQDQARRTDFGAVRLRLEELLTDDRYERSAPGTHHWGLAGAGEPVGPTDRQLLEAAQAVQVKAVRWSSEHRRAPMAATPDLHRVMTAVLTSAGGAVDITQLTHTFVRRFGVVLMSEVDLDDEDSYPGRAGYGPTADRTVTLPDAHSRARQIFVQLTDAERRCLLVLNDIPRMCEILNAKRSAAYNVRARLEGTLRALAAEDVDHEALVSELCRLVEAGIDAR